MTPREAPTSVAASNRGFSYSWQRMAWQPSALSRRRKGRSGVASQGLRWRKATLATRTGVRRAPRGSSSCKARIAGKTRGTGSTHTVAPVSQCRRRSGVLTSREKKKITVETPASWRART